MEPLRFVTLGPEGSCHQNAVNHYLRYHGAPESVIRLLDDPMEGLELVRTKKADFLVQCSAHLTVHLVVERYPREVFVTDTFLFPTREMVILEREDVALPRSLGLPKPAEGYLTGLHYPQLIYETTKPVVGRNLLAGKYDAGLTTMNFYNDHPGRFRIRKTIGRVLTTWLVFGKENPFKGQVMGARPRGFLIQNG